MIGVVRDREEAVKTCTVEKMTGEEKICNKSVGGFIISIDAGSEIKKSLVAGGVAVSNSVSPGAAMLLYNAAMLDAVIVLSAASR